LSSGHTVGLNNSFNSHISACKQSDKTHQARNFDRNVDRREQQSALQRHLVTSVHTHQSLLHNITKYHSSALHKFCSYQHNNIYYYYYHRTLVS